MPSLKFERSFRYPEDPLGLILPATLRASAAAVTIPAIVDTGCWACAFERRHGEALGVTIEEGQRVVFTTATGALHAYGHRVEIETLGVSTESTVFFFESPDVRKNLLGRNGWLDRIRLGIVDYDQTIYIAPYDFED